MTMNIFKHLLELFFPRLCVSCNCHLLENENHLCIKCLISIPKTNHLKQENNKLEEFFSGRFEFKEIASFSYFVKGGIVQKIVHNIKYKNNPQLAVFMGYLCAKEIKKYNKYSTVDYIVPIPLHPKRLKERGYNQSLMLAQGIVNLLNIEIETENLIRKINNPSQTKNSRTERWLNTEGIFEIKDKSKYENKHILLIDDIVTTGSTLEVCARCILSCENSTVSVFTLGSAI